MVRALVQVGRDQRREVPVQVLGHRQRIHLDVRELGGVTLEVHFQVALGGETAAAHVALERPLACVRPDVYLERGIAAEHFAAVPAPVLVEVVAPAATTATTGLAIVRRQGTALATTAASGTLPERQFVREIVGQQPLAGLVKHLLGAALQHLQRVRFAGRRRRVQVGDDGRGERGRHGTRWDGMVMGDDRRRGVR